MYMKELEQEKRRRQQEKIDALLELSDEEIDRLYKEGEAEAERIKERFRKKPPRGRQG